MASLGLKKPPGCLKNALLILVKIGSAFSEAFGVLGRPHRVSSASEVHFFTSRLLSGVQVAPPQSMVPGAMSPPAPP